MAQEVIALRPMWTTRSPRSSFFTLGVNAYMDLAPSADARATYYDKVAASNALLDRRFGGLYLTLARRLGHALGMPARYADDLARPSCHIWTESGIPRTAGGSIHFDLQYQRVLDEPHYAAATGTVSFTLPVRLPAAGSSLLVWPAFTYPEALTRLELARTTPPLRIEYSLGRALVHTGHVLHQIGPTPDISPGDLRITVQGHGIVVDDELVLYW
ncbi:hypothetical protein [Intrasporangium oryzae]|uniref:hypothetical protein n=1 Tax=Intrasporangium oryzae TaxID=412687 RepID=UPI0004B258A6|nr:hypothetical protein [Intrasporangium oryzae]